MATRNLPAPATRDVEWIMRRLARAITGLELPVVEKIAEAQKDDAFQVLIATLLSARTQDATTAAASGRLFAAAPTPAAMAVLPVRRIERLIFPVSFYRTKAVHVKATCRMLLDTFDGKVPGSMEELLTLPGVGRKTANLVLILGFKSLRNICVDTHVHRISNRMGWVRTRVPDQTELALYERLPARWWPYINLYLVTWGQNVCRPISPRCGECVIADRCPGWESGDIISPAGFRQLGLAHEPKERIMRQMLRVCVAVAVVGAWIVGQGTAFAQAPGNPVVVMELAKGTVTIELYPQEAPKTVENFLNLVKKNFYNRLHFHRVEAFVVQVGDPDSKNIDRRDSWGRRGNGLPIGVAEISKKLTHKKGAVGMAHAGDPTKADSQFYITKLPKKIPEGKYAIFGQVISGMDVVDKIELGDLIKRMYVK